MESEVSKFVRTTAINKLLKMTARKKVVQGSTFAGKTYGIMPILINKASKKEKLKITVVAETLPAVREGAMDIFKTIMMDTHRWREEGWNASHLVYTFTNGSRIHFKAFDSVGKAKAYGKKDILFINEANHVAFAIADTLMTRHEEIWIDFNPDEPFWAHTETLLEPNSEFLLLTYLDNEACPPGAIENLQIKMNKAFFDVSQPWDLESNIKSHYWANWCRVYVRGEVGVLEGAILTNWTQIDNIPPSAELLGYGVDFGKGGSDPTTTIAIHYYDGKVYLDEVIWESQLRDSVHVAKMKAQNVNTKLPMFCDNSEPSKIRELQLGGFPMAEGKKKETIEYGINLMMEKDIVITSRSTKLISEFRKWRYDKNGIPIDDYNHGIDAVRYFFVGKWGVNAKQKIKYKRR